MDKKQEIINDLVKYGGYTKEGATKLVEDADKLANAAKNKIIKNLKMG